LLVELDLLQVYGVALMRRSVQLSDNKSELAAFDFNALQMPRKTIVAVGWNKRR
jgi:hypothetical protein